MVLCFSFQGGRADSFHILKDAIVGNVEASGLQADCPLREGIEMSAEEAAGVEDEAGALQGYAHVGSRMCMYVCVLLFRVGWSGLMVMQGRVLCWV
jgi:hypothetical protein